MADHAGENDSFVDSVTDKVNDKFHSHDYSSDSDDDKGKKSPVNAVKTKIYRLFGREKPVHKVLGGGKRTLLKSLSVFILNADTCRLFRMSVILIHVYMYFQQINLSLAYFQILKINPIWINRTNIDCVNQVDSVYNINIFISEVPIESLVLIRWEFFVFLFS